MMSISGKRKYFKRKKRIDDGDLFSSAALLFLDMAKDFVDTFKPYKSKTHLKRDLLQALYGFYNIFLAVYNVFFSLFILLAGIAHPLYSIFTDGLRYAIQEFRNNMLLFVGSLANTAAFAIRGLTQIVTAPLTGLRAAGRGIYAAIRGWQPFNNNAGVKRLVAEGNALIATPTGPNSRAKIISILRELNDKMIKSFGQGQPVFIDPVEFSRTESSLAAHFSLSFQKDSSNDAPLTRIGALCVKRRLKLFSDTFSNPTREKMTCNDFAEIIYPRVIISPHQS